MRKVLKNKKGFTLIELLAVIVVLAVIMVIATQQVNEAIKKSRTRAYADTVVSIKKGLQTVCAQEPALTVDDIRSTLEFSDVDIKVVLHEETGIYNKIQITPSENGKFSNMNLDILDAELSGTYEVVKVNGKATGDVTFTSDCAAAAELVVPAID